MTTTIETQSTLNFSVLADSLSSFLTDGYHITRTGACMVQGQFKAKPASFQETIGKLAPGSDIASWIDLYCQLLPLKFEWASGDDIHEVFENFRPGSCMRFGSCAEMREIYAKNSSKVGCVYWQKAWHPGYCSSGSALVWLGKDTCYLDRIYGGSWAHSHFGKIAPVAMLAYVQERFGREHGKSVYGSHSSIEPASKVTLSLKWHGGRMPYMDSLCHAHLDQDTDIVTLSNRSFPDSSECQSTDGVDLVDGSGEFDAHCCSCNCGIDTDDGDYSCTGYGDIYCQDCYDEQFCYCEYSGHDVSSDDIQQATVIDSRGRVQEWYISREALRSDFHEYAGNEEGVEFIHEDYAVELADGSGYVSSDEVCDYDHKGDENTQFYNVYDSDEVYGVDDVVWSIVGECWVSLEFLESRPDCFSRAMAEPEGGYRMGPWRVHFSEGQWSITLFHGNLGQYTQFIQFDRGTCKTGDWWHCLRRLGVLASSLCADPQQWAWIAGYDSTLGPAQYSHAYLRAAIDRALAVE